MITQKISQSRQFESPTKFLLFYSIGEKKVYKTHLLFRFASILCWILMKKGRTKKLLPFFSKLHSKWLCSRWLLVLTYMFIVLILPMQCQRRDSELRSDSTLIKLPTSSFTFNTRAIKTASFCCYTCLKIVQVKSHFNFLKLLIITGLFKSIKIFDISSVV